MSPGSSDWKDPAEGLSFVDELKRDISSYLLQSPEDGVEQANIIDCIPGTLCYSSPHDYSEDRWREARNAGGSDEANAGSTKDGTCLRFAERIFGAPPLSSEIRWPPRPQEQQQEDYSSLRHSLLRRRGTPDRGDGSDSNNSDSEGSCDSETGARRNRWCRSYMASRDQSGSGREGERRTLASTASSGDLRHHEDRRASQRREHSERNVRPPLRGRRHRSLSDVCASRPCATPEACMNGGSSSSSSNVSPDGRVAASQVNVNELLEFSSCFESGNLQYSVYNVEDDSYSLILDTDVHTRGHTQWFYFAVRNGRLGQTARFRVVNMSKAKSLFCLGMKPLVWSEVEIKSLPLGNGTSSVFPLDAEPASNLWRACTQNVEYRRSRAGTTTLGNYHTLAFEYTFEWPNDCVFFAYCVPFTYSMLRTSLSAMAADPIVSPRCRFRCLSNTTGNVQCDLVEISNFSISRKLKKAVVVSSRVHPGESNASWKVNGLMKFLVSDCAEACVLRDHFIWQIVPMLNPDGVVCGNYRCGLTGVDLNRQWRRPHKELHCTVYKLKKLIHAAKRKARLCMYLDLHGHSRKCGVFSYACADYPRDDYRRFTVRMFPKLLSMLTPEFEFPSCRWRVGKGKRGTGRVVVSKDLGLTETYTIETSFFGAVIKEPPEAALQSRASPPPEEDGGSDSEGSDQDRASPGCGAASPDVDTKGIPPSRIILFTPSKLEEIGGNLARALLLQQNLGPAVQLAEKRLARQKARPTERPEQGRGRAFFAQTQSASRSQSGPCAIVPGGPPCERESAFAPGTATPSGASDASDSEEDLLEAPELSANEPLVSVDGDQVDKVIELGLTPEEAEELRRPYLDIDVAEVLQDVEDDLPHAQEVECDSPGSDSEPSEDNFDQQELVQLARIFTRKRKSTRRGTSGLSGGGGSIGGLTTSGSQARPVHSALSRAKAEAGGGSSRSSRRKSRNNDRQACRRDRRANASGHSQRSEVRIEVPKEIPKTVQRTVAFGQTTYVVPPRPAQNFAGSSGRSLSTGTSPITERSLIDSQAFSLYADIGVEKAGGILSPERDRVRRLQGWGQQQWPAITAAPGRQCPAQKEVAQGVGHFVGGAHSEAYVLMGTPPKDRFAFPQGGVADARRLNSGPVASKSLGHGRSIEEVVVARPRVCARNASSSMLQWQRTYTSAPLPTSQSSAIATSLLGSSIATPTQSQSVSGLAVPDRRLGRASSKQKLASRPGTASARSPVNGVTEESCTPQLSDALLGVEIKTMEDAAIEERPESPTACGSKSIPVPMLSSEKVAAQCQIFSPIGLGNATQSSQSSKVFRQDFTLRHRK